MMKNLFSSTVLWASACAIAACASDEAQTITPGEQGHILKLTREMIRLGTAKDSDAKANYFLQAGEERLKELKQMDRQGKTTHFDALAQSYEKNVTQGARGAIESGVAEGKDMSKASQRYEEATAKHLLVLEALLNKVPPQARKGIAHAIEASKHGHEQALLGLEKSAAKAKSKGAGSSEQGGDLHKPTDKGKGHASGEVKENPGSDESAKMGTAKSGPTGDLRKKDKGEGKEDSGQGSDKKHGPPPADKVKGHDASDDMNKKVKGASKENSDLGSGNKGKAKEDSAPPVKGGPEKTPADKGKPGDKGKPQDKGSPSGMGNLHSKNDPTAKDKTEDADMPDDKKEADDNEKENRGKGAGEGGPPPEKGHGKGK